MAKTLVETADRLDRTPELRVRVVQLFADVDRLLQSDQRDVRLDVLVREGQSVGGQIFGPDMQPARMFAGIVGLYRTMTQVMRNFGTVAVKGHQAATQTWLEIEPPLRYEFSLVAVNPVSAVFPTAEPELVDRHAYLALMELINAGQMVSTSAVPAAATDEVLARQLAEKNAQLKAAREQNAALRYALSETKRVAKAVEVAQAGVCVQIAQCQRLAGALPEHDASTPVADAMQ